MFRKILDLLDQLLRALSANKDSDDTSRQGDDNDGHGDDHSHDEPTEETPDEPTEKTPDEPKDEETPDEPTEETPYESEDEETSDDEVQITWPPNDCVEVPEASGDETIEFKLYAADGYRQEVEAVRPYVEYAFADAYGDRYGVEVTVSDTTAPQGLTDDTYRDWLENQNDLAKDGNIVIYQDEGSIRGLGGAQYAQFSKAGELEGFDPNCVKRLGWNDKHHAINTIIMEVGHCLGLGHNGEKVNWKGEEWTGSGDSFITPMSTGYTRAQGYIHELWKGLHDKDLQIQ